MLQHEIVDPDPRKNNYRFEEIYIYKVGTHL